MTAYQRATGLNAGKNALPVVGYRLLRSGPIDRNHSSLKVALADGIRTCATNAVLCWQQKSSPDKTIDGEHRTHLSVCFPFILSGSRCASMVSASRTRETDMKIPQTCTVATLLAEPDRLVAVSDLVSANVITSGQASRRWVRQGWLPKPIRLPNGQLRWTAGAVVKTVGLEQVAA